MDDVTLNKHLQVIEELSRRWENHAHEFQKMCNSPFAPEGVAGAPQMRESVVALVNEISRSGHERRMKRNLTPVKIRIRRDRVELKSRPVIQSCYLPKKI